MQLGADPFLDQFLKIFVMLVGATLVAGGLWRLSYDRRKRKLKEAWAGQAGRTAQ